VNNTTTTTITLQATTTISAFDAAASLLERAEFAAGGRKHVRFSYQGEKDTSPRDRELVMGQAIHNVTGEGSWMTGHREGKNGWLIVKGGEVYISGFEVLRDEKGRFSGQSGHPKCFRMDRVTV
jgi:hypothetical protein